MGSVQRATAELIQTADTTFVEFLPKQHWNTDRTGWTLFTGVSRGYKTSGFNIQVICDLISDKLKHPPELPKRNRCETCRDVPTRESWNYEAGIQIPFWIENCVHRSRSLYGYQGLRLTEFVTSGAGTAKTQCRNGVSKRMAGRFEDLKITPMERGLSYGYAHASFKTIHRWKRWTDNL